MTVNTGGYLVKAAANGTTFTFHFSGMPIYAASELLVYEVDDATDVATLLTEGTGSTNYSVTPTTSFSDGPSAGFITYPADSGTPIAAGKTIWMLRAQNLRQLQSFSSLGVQLPSNVEIALDRITYMLQNQQEEIDRCLKLVIGDSFADLEYTGTEIAQLGQDADAAAASASAAAASAAAAQATVDNAFVLDTVTESTTTRTLALADSTKWIRCTNAAGCTITLPQDSDVAFTVGTIVSFEQVAAGVVAFVAGTGATMNKPSTHNAQTNTQWAVAQAKKVAADTWIIFGNLQPV